MFIGHPNSFLIRPFAQKLPVPFQSPQNVLSQTHFPSGMNISFPILFFCVNFMKLTYDLLDLFKELSDAG